MSYDKHVKKWLMRYPAISDLENKARGRLPFVAWEYLQCGTGQEDLLRDNIDDLTAIRFLPQFLKGTLNPDIATTIFGQTYNAPFGVAPVGLTGLMWPRAEILLAAAATRCGIPYTLSTVATETPEAVGKQVDGQGWFQLYPPREKALRSLLLKRAQDNGFNTLVVTADVPVPSRRERTKRAGVEVPPVITPHFIWEALTHPRWSWETLKRGIPRLRTIEAYSEFKSMMSVGAFVQNNLGGNLSWQYCEELRDEWDGPMILKGILHPGDAERAISTGFDGIVVSNHGARQFDGAPSAIYALPEIARTVNKRAVVMFDSGIRSGLDVLRALYLGADFVLCGRAFMYGVCALGKYGGDHVVQVLTDELKNNMAQLGVESLPAIRELKRAQIKQ